MPANLPEPAEMESSVNLQTFLTFLLALTAGLLLAVLVLPSWLPNMAFSLSGEAPKVFWYLARATAFASLSLLWVSMALGLSITNKMARLWPGAPAAFAIHEYVNLLGIAFAIFHALILLGDHYIGFTFVQVLMPFSTTTYRPFWVGIGQLGFYVWLLVTLSFYVRQGIGQMVDDANAVDDAGRQGKFKVLGQHGRGPEKRFWCNTRSIPACRTASLPERVG